MIVSRAFAGKRYAVLGLARSGLATVESLHASGAQVTAWDRRPGPREAVAAIAAIGDPMEIDLAGFEAVVVSPGVPLNTPRLVVRARSAGVPPCARAPRRACRRARRSISHGMSVAGSSPRSAASWSASVRRGRSERRR